MNINIFVVKSKKWVVTISLKLQDLLLERVIYYPYVNIYTVTSWCEIKKKDNEWHLFLNIFQKFKLVRFNLRTNSKYQSILGILGIFIRESILGPHKKS